MGQPKRKIGNRCVTCARDDVKEVNKQIARGATYKDIQDKYGIVKSSLHRHITRCLKLEPITLVKQHQQEQAVDVYKEFQEQLEFAKSLRLASQEQLSDPDDPLRMSLIPRAEEIEVIYHDHQDLLNGRPKKKKAMLSVLLELLAGEGDQRFLEADKFTIKKPDIRKFALDAITTADLCIDKFAKMGGLYARERDNPQTIEKALESFTLWAEKNPKATPEQTHEAITTFARGLNVSKHELMLKAGIQELETVQ
jgi:hypothetical protein